MLIGKLVTHQSISASVVLDLLGSFTDGSQNTVWPLALEEEILHNYENRSKIDTGLRTYLVYLSFLLVSSLPAFSQLVS